MDRPDGWKLDHKSLCSSCNSYKLGEHQPWCELAKQKQAKVMDAGGRLLAAEADYLHATGWQPHVSVEFAIDGGVRWKDPVDSLMHQQTLAVTLQRKRDKF